MCIFFYKNHLLANSSYTTRGVLSTDIIFSFLIFPIKLMFTAMTCHQVELVNVSLKYGCWFNASRHCYCVVCVVVLISQCLHLWVRNNCLEDVRKHSLLGKLKAVFFYIYNFMCKNLWFPADEINNILYILIDPN